MGIRGYFYNEMRLIKLCFTYLLSWNTVHSKLSSKLHFNTKPFYVGHQASSVTVGVDQKWHTAVNYNYHCH